MEYIKGEDLAHYCDRKRLKVRERIELMIKVCDAVHYAHQNLVVHRDLKPANILVNEMGDPKLLDFGIAKPLDMDQTGTHTGKGLMTPDYASPEQVKGSGISTATDIYSLGVILYELLTGHRPFQLKTRSPEEMLRLICHQEPRRPSAAVTGKIEFKDGEGRVRVQEPRAVSRKRGVDPNQLSHILTGDLDNIVLMALRKDPRRRYASAKQMAEDLERYLNGYPIQARQETLTYSLGKFVKRNRFAVGAMALIFTILLTFSSVVFYQQQVTARERDKARGVTDFLVQVFSVSDPYAVNPKDGETVTARELLDQAAEEIQDESSAEPLARAHLMAVLGRVQMNLGLYDRAEPLIHQALELRRRNLESNHEEILESELLLGELQLASGAYGEARETFTGVYEQRLKQNGQGDTRVIQDRIHVAKAMMKQQKYDEAATLYREILTQLEKTPNQLQRERADVLFDLGFILSQLREYEEAYPLYARCLALREQLVGTRHPLIADTLNEQGFLAIYTSRFDEAEIMLNRAVDIYTDTIGRIHPNIARGLANLSDLRRHQGNIPEAMLLIQEALYLNRRALGDGHPTTVGYMVRVAFLALRLERLDEAEVLFREALTHNRVHQGGKHYWHFLNLQYLGYTLQRQGRYDGAEASFRQAMALGRQLFGEIHPYTLFAYVDLADLSLKRGDPVTAEEYAWKAINGYALLPEAEFWFPSAGEVMGEAMALQGCFEEAEKHLKLAWNAAVERYGEGEVNRLEVLQRLVLLYELWGKDELEDEHRKLLLQEGG